MTAVVVIYAMGGSAARSDSVKTDLGPGRMRLERLESVMMLLG